MQGLLELGDKAYQIALGNLPWAVTAAWPGLALDRPEEHGLDHTLPVQCVESVPLALPLDMWRLTNCTRHESLRQR
jgi:hypothetical protein